MLKILYSLFFICGIFGGSKYIGGILSYRHLMSVIMFAYCLYNFRYLSRAINKYIVLYLIFILFWILSSLNEEALDSCIKTILAQHFVSLIGYFSSVLLYKKIGSLDLLCKLLFITGLLNAIVCYMQYIGNPYGISIGLYFIDTNNIIAINQFELLSSGQTSGLYLFGLLGNAVYNGYFSMIIPFVPLYFYFQDSQNKNILPYIFTSVLFLFVVFLIQERSCFIISTLMLLILIYKTKILTGGKLVLCAIFVSFFTLFSGFDFILNSDIVENSRFLSDSEESRSMIYSKAWAFISNNILLGGIENFRAIAHYSPHNIFLNALIHGGIIGGMVLIVLYLSQIYFSYRLFVNKKQAILAVMFVSLMLNALLHNDSILTGDLLVWILWGAILSESKLGNSTIVN